MGSLFCYCLIVEYLAANVGGTMGKWDWNKIVTIVTGAATVAIASATISQCCVTQSQLAEMRSTAKQTNEAIIEIRNLTSSTAASVEELKNANSLTKSALQKQDVNIKIARKSVTVQQDYYEKTSRPFLHIPIDSIKVISQNDKSTDTFKTQYCIENIGPLPAKSMQSGVVYLGDRDTTFLRNRPLKPLGNLLVTALFPKEKSFL